MENGNGNGHGSSNGNGGSIHVERFDRIVGTTKGRWEHKLTDGCVAFLGRNRQGKTSRLDAIRIALTGRHPVGPHGTDLFQLAPEGALTFKNELSGPNASTSLTVEVEGGRPRKPPEKPARTGALLAIESLPESDKIFERMLPTISMRDLVKGSTLTREAVFRRFGEITALPLPRGLTDEQKKLWHAAAAESKKGADFADVLSAMSAFFRKSKLDRGREAKALEELLKERETALVPQTAGAEELPELKNELARAEAWERGAELRARREAIEAEAAAFNLKAKAIKDAEESSDVARRAAERDATDQVKRAELEALEGRVVGCENAIRAALEERSKAIVDEVEKWNRDLTELNASLDEQIKKELFYLTGGEWLLECVRVLETKVDAKGHAPCILCGNASDVAQLRAQVSPKVEARRARVTKLTDEKTAALRDAESARNAVKLALIARHSAKIQQLEGEKTAALRARDEARSAYATWKTENANVGAFGENEKNLLKQEYARIKSAREENARALEGTPTSYEGPTALELRTRIKTLEDADTAARQLDAETKKLRELLAERELYKILEQEAARELNTLLTRTAVTAEAAVNRYMPKGFVAKLDVESAQWTVVGTDGRAHGKKVMAGSEFGALMPALALAWTEGAPARYVLLDDEDLAFFDPENLALLLQSLKAAVADGTLTQVFLAWSRGHEIPDDWGQKIYVDNPKLAAIPSATSSDEPMMLL